MSLLLSALFLAPPLSVSCVVVQARLNLCFTSSVFRNPMGIFDLEIKFVWEIFFPSFEEQHNVLHPTHCVHFDEILIIVLHQRGRQRGII